MAAVLRGGRHRAAPAALLVLALTAACGPAGSPAAQPPPARTTASSPARATAPVAEADAGAGGVRPAGRSLPDHLDIPRIGVSTPVGDVGLNADGTIEVPPFVKHSPAAWYRYSPTPGEVGPAVLLGHSTMGKYGPSVFFRLGALRPGDRIDVRRRDGRTARFAVERVAAFPKDAFPTEQVYGDTDRAALRLITCGGDRSPGEAHYPDNVVVFARLVSVTG